MTGISDCIGSNMQLHLSDGSQLRVTLKLELSDFVVKTILDTMRRILPHEKYEKLVVDTVNVI